MSARLADASDVFFDSTTADQDGAVYCASHKNWTSVHQLPFQNHCFIVEDLP